MNKKINVLSFCAITLLFFACKKNESPAPATLTAAGTVLSSEANVVILPNSVTLANSAASLYNAIDTFRLHPTQPNLTNCQQLWRSTSAVYEQTAASLFGPNGSLGADPASLINTYPIDTFGINSLVTGPVVSQSSEDSIVATLPSYLIGFHGIEFELYGINGTKMASQFTPQQLSYITAVAFNIATLTGQVDTLWGSYPFANAGAGSSVYPTQTAAFSDLTMGIANICETDGIYKLDGILYNKSVILQESPFANNSLNDILNNLYGVQNIYLGQYNGITGTGLTVFVSQLNVSLDLKIKNDLKVAITTVGAITGSLSQAIYNQTNKVYAAANACDSLDDDLKVSLLTYLNSKTN